MTTTKVLEPVFTGLHSNVLQADMEWIGVPHGKAGLQVGKCCPT